MRIGLLTGGGDCAAFHAVLRALVISGQRSGDTFVGFRDGWRGVLELDTVELAAGDLADKIGVGGTLLGSSRTNPYSQGRDPEELLRSLRSAEIDALAVLGGEDTLAVAERLHRDHLFPVVGVPKTIDNDLSGTELTFGFDTAVQVCTDMLDRLTTTALSHSRVMVCEVMGRHAGHIAIHSAIAAGASAVFLPETSPRVADLCEILLSDHQRSGPRSHLVVAAEGALPKDLVGQDRRAETDEFGHPQLGGVGSRIASQIETTTGWETRYTVLGHVQRGGSPSAFDRVLATRLGLEALKAIHESDFGKMVAYQCGSIGRVLLSEAIARLKLVDNEFLEDVRPLFLISGQTGDRSD